MLVYYYDQFVHMTAFLCEHRTRWLSCSICLFLVLYNVWSLFMLSASFCMVFKVSGGTPIICVIASVFFRKMSKICLTISESLRETEFATMSMLFVNVTGIL